MQLLISLTFFIFVAATIASYYILRALAAGLIHTTRSIRASRSRSR